MVKIDWLDAWKHMMHHKADVNCEKIGCINCPYSFTYDDNLHDQYHELMEF